MRRRVVLFTALGSLGSLLSGCTSESACIAEPLADQPRQRFPVGSTFYLPVFDTTKSGCGETTWTLVDAPAESTNDVVHGADGISRFTPDAPGSYRFEVGSTGDDVELTAIDSDDVPFIHHNYYPSHGLARVDGELWVANAFTPRIGRLDPDTLAVEGSIDVGPWPVAVAWASGMDVAVVAHRAGDTIGLVDIRSKQLIDAVWVGDEPSNVVVDAKGERAYVALPYQAQVAVVDVGKAELVTTIDVGPDPMGMAISPDGETLYVASHRSGHPNRYPYDPDPVEDERDLSIIDTESETVVETVLDLGTTIKQLYMPPEGDVLYVTHLRNDTETSLSDPATANFQHYVTALDPSDGSVVAKADLARQPSSAGPIAMLHGMTRVGGTLWVAVEANDLVLGLDPTTLEETHRVEVSGRPRHILGWNERIFVHGVQTLSVTALSSDGSVEASANVDDDPRDSSVAAGQRYFTGVGRDFATTWACNSCHADGLTDTLVWNAGPLSDRVVTRPFNWLEGISPLGWAGYLSSAKNYAYVVNQNVGIRPTTDEALNLGSYISSIVAPPAANAWTLRDGGLSAAAIRGQELFEGKGNCSTCHPMPLSTHRGILPEGITAGVSKSPALVGAYRYGTWLKHGEARTLGEAVDAAAAFAGADLSDEELDDLTRYVSELTGRDFFVLGSNPQPGDEAIPVDRPLQLTFSLAAFDGRRNLDRIRLLDESGDDVPTEINLDARHVTLTPTSALAYDSEYTIEIGTEFESFGERHLTGPSEIPFRTAAEPVLALADSYEWRIEVPGLKPDGSGLDKDNTTTARVPMKVEITASGARIVVDYGQDLVYEGELVLDGDQLILPPLPVPMGPAFVDSNGSRTTFMDEDGDGVGDRADATLTLQGPGLSEDGIQWSIVPPPDDDACEEGSSGAIVVDVAKLDDAIEITWNTEDLGLGLYVTDPGANVPAGGGVVTGGNTYWAIVTSAFPEGFAQPVLYGEVPEGAMDDTATHSGTFERPISGKCYKFTVATTAFAIGERILRWP